MTNPIWYHWNGDIGITGPDKGTRCQLAARYACPTELSIVIVPPFLRPTSRRQQEVVGQTVLNLNQVSQPRVHRLTLQSKHGEDALMHPPQRLSPDESLQPFDTEGKFPQGERPLMSQPPAA
jgi:hypothetical protein